MLRLFFFVTLYALGISNVLGKKRQYDRNMLFRFTSKSCGICERFSKDWDKLVRESDTGTLKNIDCDKDTAFCLEQDIRSFPSFKLYSKYEGFVKYFGSTDFKPLKEFVKTMTKMDCYALKTCSPEFYKWLESSPDMSLEKAIKELKEVNHKFMAVFQNISGKIMQYKSLAYNKVDYIYNYEKEL